MTPVFKSGRKKLLTKYRPISVLTCASKILGRMMYKWVNHYVNDSNLFFLKQFHFRKGHSTDHTLIELIYIIHDSSHQSKYILGVSIDFSKASDTVYHNILISKLNLCDITSNSPNCLSSYLSKRKEFVQTGPIKTYSLEIICGVSKWSILGPRDATNGGEGVRGGGFLPFWKLKETVLILGKKCPDYVHLWVKFLI